MAKKDKPDDGLARKIWLAGIGAYGRAFSDAVEGVAKASQETARRFEDLAKRGADLEDKASELIQDRVKLFERPPLEERLDQFRTAFGLRQQKEAAGDDDGNTEKDIKALKAEIAALESQVDALNAQLKEKPKAAPRKRAVKKPAAKKPPTRKTAAKKAAPKKPTPEKPTPKKSTPQKS